MAKLTLEEWDELSEKEKGNQYKDLSDHDKFLVRVTRIPMGGRTVGYTEPNEEQKESARIFGKAVLEGKIDEWFEGKYKG